MMGKRAPWDNMSKRKKASKAKRDSKWKKKYPSLSRPKLVAGGLSGSGRII
jgi:hypothetical protein